MGCAQSRDENRKDAFGADFNVVGYAFKGVLNENVLDLHPFDKIVSAYLGEASKEAKDAAFGALAEGKFEKPEALEAGATKLFNSLKALHAWAKEKADAEKPSVWGKYKQD